jgi:hypothetical protein
MSAAADFQQALGSELAVLLGPGYTFLKSKNEIRAEVEGGHHVAVLSGSNKYSPFVEVAFYFGKNFAAAKRIEKQLGLFQFNYHVQQYSPNCQHSNRRTYLGPCTWSVDILNPSPTLAAEVAEAIIGLSEPFLKKYSTLVAARDAIATDDPDVFGGRTFWAQLLRLDLALDDLLHFEAWSSQLDELSRRQAEEVIRKYRTLRGDA